MSGSNSVVYYVFNLLERPRLHELHRRAESIAGCEAEEGATVASELNGISAHRSYVALTS